MTAKRIGRLKRHPDLSEWNRNIEDAVRRHMMNAVTAAIDVAMSDEDTCAELSAVYSDEQGRGDGHETSPKRTPRSVDPLAVYLSISLSKNITMPLYVFDIRESLKQTIAYCADDGSFAPGLRRIMVAMRELADEIDGVLPK